MIPITIAFETVPVPKGRARFGRGRVYTPSVTRDFQYDFGWQAKAAMGDRKPFASAIKITALFELPIPDSWSQQKRALAIDGVIRPTARPDLDNYIKAVLDSCNGIVFADDALIVELTATKRYGINPKIVLTISPVAEAGS